MGITENSSVQSRNEGVFFTLKKTYTVFNSEVWRMSPLGLGRKQRYDLLFNEDWTFQGERWTGKLGKTLKRLEKKNTLIIWRDECVQSAQKNMKTIVHRTWWGAANEAGDLKTVFYFNARNKSSIKLQHLSTLKI